MATKYGARSREHGSRGKPNHKIRRKGDPLGGGVGMGVEIEGEGEWEGEGEGEGQAWQVCMYVLPVCSIFSSPSQVILLLYLYLYIYLHLLLLHLHLLLLHIHLHLLLLPLPLPLPPLPPSSHLSSPLLSILPLIIPLSATQHISHPPPPPSPPPPPPPSPFLLLFLSLPKLIVPLNPIGLRPVMLRGPGGVILPRAKG